MGSHWASCDTWVCFLQSSPVRHYYCKSTKNKISQDERNPLVLSVFTPSFKFFPSHLFYLLQKGHSFGTEVVTRFECPVNCTGSPQDNFWKEQSLRWLVPLKCALWEKEDGDGRPFSILLYGNSSLSLSLTHTHTHTHCDKNTGVHAHTMFNSINKMDF